MGNAELLEDVGLDVIQTESLLKAERYILTIAQRLKLAVYTITVYVNIIVDIYLFTDWFISESVLVIPRASLGFCCHSGLGKK